MEDNKVSMLEMYNPMKGEYILRWNTDQGIQEKILDHKPDKSEIVSIVTAWFDDRVDKEIEFGYSYDDIPVQLSKENEDNYFKSFVFAALSQLGGLNLIQYPVTWKLGTKDKPVIKEFNSFNEIMQFCIGAYMYKDECLRRGFITKNNIDWSVYD